MVRVFLDANVLFSASNPGSNIERLIQLLTEHGQAVSSDFAIEEARRNITVKRPDWIDGFNTLVQRIETAPSTRFKLPVELTEKDQPILCTAIRAECVYLVTGDKRDFGHLYNTSVGSVRIVDLVGLARVVVEIIDR
ncbi:MAG: PIN domain-containing protein [Phycisphaerales bacterium]|nr:PIN domain-containing protein [Phycisphaerales bacterium]